VENLTKYVMGVAAKSNVEKRKVGCLLLDSSGDIVGQGFNDVKVHAELNAIHNWKNGPATDSQAVKAIVTHPPCPDCARALQLVGIQRVEVVEAFMKFDGDKPRFDLIDPMFALLVLKFDNWNQPFPKKEELKAALYQWSVRPEFNTAEDWGVLLNLVFGQYKDFYHMEHSLAAVLTFGARKYKPGNWKECTDTGRYLAAAHRHLNATEELDDETNLPHRDHLLCNLMFLYVLGLK